MFFSVRTLIPAFSFTLFMSAMLLFWVEPMFAKMILPLLGGAPAIWITAMLFYQLALLSGYAYAHATSRWLKPSVQAIVHITLLLLTMLLLPIAIPSGWSPPVESNPVPWLLCLLTVALGCPFVLLAATTPMVQHWFTTTKHPDAGNPYFLYAVSNAGSLAGLFAYPLLIEPNMRLIHQSFVWSAGFVLLSGLVLLAALLTWWMRVGTRAHTKTQDAEHTEGQADKPIGWKEILHWVSLAAVPSSLMLSVTNFIVTDIAAIPLMWIIPLALYLLTFIIAFSTKPFISNRFALWFQPFLIVPLCIVLVPVLGKTGISPLYFIPLHLAVFFLSALICHFELMRLRPVASHLTKYFLVLSFGGALGGLFNVLIAPSLFNDVYEYPLGLILVCLLRPWPKENIWLNKTQIVAALMCGVAMFAAEVFGRPEENSPILMLLAFKAFLVIGAVFLFMTRKHPLWLGVGVGMFLLTTMVVPASTSLLHAERNFFGVVRVRLSPDGSYRMLEHGTTVHGVEALDTKHRLVPLSYYSQYGGMGDTLNALSKTRETAKIGVIGLGAGSLVCYGNPDWHYTFYEIDPIVVKVAQNTNYFSYLNDCGHKNEVVLGDGRLSIQNKPAGYFDEIILDAFSSDVIPLHLLTLEAMRIYLDRLSPNGVIVLHLSNRYFNLVPIVAAAARDLGLVSIVRMSPGGTLEGTTLPYYASIVMNLARKTDDFGTLTGMQGWHTLSATHDIKSWTDDYSNLLQALMLN